VESFDGDIQDNGKGGSYALNASPGATQAMLDADVYDCNTSCSTGLAPGAFPGVAFPGVVDSTSAVLLTGLCSYLRT